MIYPHRVVVSVLCAAIGSALLLSACSSTQSMANLSETGAGIMFPVDEQTADQILASAMSRQFSGSPISRVTLPNPGYQTTIRFLLDSHTVVAYMIPVSSLSTEGEMIEGFYFEVSNSGTMPISGGNNADQLYDLIIEYAEREADPLPITR
ncbi:MAG: hypothetical protein H2040_11245 [Euryhalocaulis sp.]|uniref:hypothetical protein n=1 Tax=Euryhalocaulis sp. TaxID=2744307 RepID=UPI0017E7AF49|nr:hypothetical protein [Euryhalocaulis sp.]MBA4802428.1 hypothetical protein [Euryhalocaulis sp.]